MLLSEARHMWCWHAPDEMKHQYECVCQSSRTPRKRVWCVSPELVESVRIVLEHLPHVEVSCVGFVPLLQFAVDRIAAEPHDEKIPVLFGPEAAKVKHNRSSSRSVRRIVRRKYNDKSWQSRPSWQQRILRSPAHCYTALGGKMVM